MADYFVNDNMILIDVKALDETKTSSGLLVTPSVGAKPTGANYKDGAQKLEHGYDLRIVQTGKNLDQEMFKPGRRVKLLEGYFNTLTRFPASHYTNGKDQKIYAFVDKSCVALVIDDTLEQEELTTAKIKEQEKHTQLIFAIPDLREDAPSCIEMLKLNKSNPFKERDLLRIGKEHFVVKAQPSGKVDFAVSVIRKAKDGIAEAHSIDSFVDKVDEVSSEELEQLLERDEQLLASWKKTIEPKTTVYKH